MLQWAREHHCPWEEDTCTLAVKGGHLAVLQWACENECPLDEGELCDAAILVYHLFSHYKSNDLTQCSHERTHNGVYSIKTTKVWWAHNL